MSISPRGYGYGCGQRAGDLNRGAAAVVEEGDPARRVEVQGDDDADEADPFDGVVVVEVEVLTCVGWKMDARCQSLSVPSILGHGYACAEAEDGC